MQIIKTSLQHFRLYEKQVFTFSPTVTVFLGANAIGKTNILESIALAAVGKSFRAVRDSDMISWGSEVGRVTHDIHNAAETVLEIVLTTGSVSGKTTQVKKYIVNGIPRRQIDFVGNLYAVLFSPTDLKLVTESPATRREYLNSVLVQVDREYRRNLQSYERGLRQRNSLLDRIHEGVASRSQLLFWDQLLIKTGSYITSCRRAFVEAVNMYVLDAMTYRIVYDPSIISAARLAQYAREEVAAKTTLVGPQRDDFRFEKLEDQTYVDLTRFGSRGEQRLAVLWIKLAELQFIEQKTGERPVLLLDDVFSELDEESRRIVLSIINKQQTIITSAEEELVPLFQTIPDAQIVRLPVS